MGRAKSLIVAQVDGFVDEAFLIHLGGIRRGSRSSAAFALPIPQRHRVNAAFLVLFDGLISLA
jgi:hypothetical protein